ncbi:NfeD family protein [uncultured Erythrobacter sp.]|uniref:NfeD family protein n=1 Tax=uncultured Erythrobacter sp. TaxID=263913 RepID=UPI0026055946|nr:NfeD family protein [uncultured Erythrobacter sp.]
MDWLATIEDPYLWLALGLLLAAAEILVPGMFLIWLAGAALMTGALAWALPIGLPLQVLVFAVLSILMVFAGRRYIRENPVEEADPKMNKRGMRMVGEQAVVVQAISGGTGRVKHGDSEWLARGPDTAEGASVRITGSDGAVLIVEAV